jgi:hypothetical protein
MIDRGKLLAIRFRLLLMLQLQACGGYMMPALSGNLRCCGPGHSPAPTSVVADARDRHIIDHPLAVNVVDLGDVHIVDHAIVVEGSPPPAATVVSVSGVAVPVIDAAIEAYFQPPITRMPPV